MPVPGVLAAVFLFIGGVATPDSRHYLTDPGHLGAFGGTLIEMAGLAAAVVAGILALTRPRPPIRGRMTHGPASENGQAGAGRYAPAASRRAQAAKLVAGRPSRRRTPSLRYASSPRRMPPSMASRQRTYSSGVPAARS